MRFEIGVRSGYLVAEIIGRESAEEMREFLVAVGNACKAHGCPKILMRVVKSRPVFKLEDYGLDTDTRGYVHEIVTPACQVALVADSAEVHAAHEYIEVVARQQNVNARAFRDESEALQWLGGEPAVPDRRYRFSRIVLLGAPEEAGVYALWDGEEIIYYGRASGGPGASIRDRLLDHLEGRAGEQTMNATHYSWEVCRDTAQREQELLDAFRAANGRPPRLNVATDAA